ncbi:phosphonatase-like hydrolase [Streptomyces tsukubensis]|uniref:HAD family hydrolase n=1 Tax=Streptomyces tsukubensis TaxID=83656 RepID=A0A1V4A7V2_9ACTN|nr:phosphonatase-like hydrolase [Streptomyces tsukubensis]OON78036.1 HAD family hydrolase [Streptomyces tsukubensis]QFR97201.1 phosphonatase-like hydrolase [Streptomyces tsukubensis]
MIDLAVLDMAGTTIDDGGAVYDALRSAVEETGVRVAPDDLQKWMGTDKKQAIEALIRLGGGAPTASSVAAAYGSFVELLRTAYDTRPPSALPGVENALAVLRDRGVRIALTTGFGSEVAGPLLDSLGWSTAPGSLLDAVVTADEVASGRPAPYMIHRAMERTGVLDVRQVLVAGDTTVDLEAGTHAGAGTVVGVLTGKLGRSALEAAPHTYVLDSVADLPGLPETS